MNKILVANRGEIAVRIIRTARELGYRTVAVYSEADLDALHVQQADEAVLIGPPAVAESYLVIDNILRAAAITGSDAIHPGYGLLSERSDFASACATANITFIGPSADAIELMGCKRAAKLAMLAAGVPCIPGYQGKQQDDETLTEQAQAIGLPLMIKASAGGGGRGIRLVTELSDLLPQIHTARSEASSAFGSGELILEKALSEPRHIEIQVFADKQGNVVHLGERDCSVQRRHQKVIEEAPSPFLDEPLRQAMGQAAINAAKACGYIGAGTVEFLVDTHRHFYFLEMNTRLQVEHPVTELVSGQDLVAWQLMVAAGEPLPLLQEQLTQKGHAIEARLYAEDPRQQFLPQTGTILRWSIPERAGIRIDHGVRVGQTVTPWYDPMLAKVIAYGDNREQAVRRLASMVQDLELLGVHNNKHFLRNALSHPVFRKGEATTAFIAQHFASDCSLADTEPSPLTVAKAALLYYRREASPDCRREASPVYSGEASPQMPSAEHFLWRSSAPLAATLRLTCGAYEYTLKLTEEAGQYHVCYGDNRLTLTLLQKGDHHCEVIANSIRSTFPYAFLQQRLLLDDGSGHFIFDNRTHLPAAKSDNAGSGQVLAPMDGAIIDVLVNLGDPVEQGQTVLIMDAMKMEHALKAQVKGTVTALTVSRSEQVTTRQVLATIAEDNPGDIQ